jgi:hypothetical protein
MMTQQKKSFMLKLQKRKIDPALGVSVPGKGTGYPAPSSQIRT